MSCARRRRLLVHLTVLVLAVLAALPAFGTTSGDDPAADLQRGQDLLARGLFRAAVPHLLRAMGGLERAGRPLDQLTAALALGEARAAIGLYREAEAAHRIALGLAEAAGDDRRVAAVLARLAVVQAATGQGDAADASLARGLEIARRADDPLLVAALLNESGNARAGRGERTQAALLYRETAARAATGAQPLLAARALANLATVLLQAGDAEQAATAVAAARGHVATAPPSHDAAFTLVNLGLAGRQLRAALPAEASRLTLQAYDDLRSAATMAETLGDRRTASFAWGYLGSLYEDEGRYREALQLTRRASFLAQQVDAPESLYRWQWHSGRLLNRLGAPEAAIAAYRRAVASLETIRPELSARSGDRAASFRETVGAVYFELVDLLLRRAAAAPAAADVQPYLAEAREVVERFKVAELRDYFRDDCVDLALQKVTSLDAIARTALVVYPILLPDRTELLVTTPAGLKRIAVPVGAERLGQEVRRFRRALEKRTTREYLPHARTLYDWLIRPLEPELAARSVDTIVFIPDGPLRTIPMAALHDGERFLVAKYALGTTPGLNVTDPRPIRREQARILAVGVTESVQGFAALPSVAPELAALRDLFPITTLVDGEFRLSAFEQKLRTEPFTILHVASHGEFGGDPDTTFLLAFDGKLTMERLDRFIGLFKFREEPLELLTLSACETAEGDDRAALGLAGVAVRAGARSALATLWSVNDTASAELVAEFYRHLRQPDVSRAGALRRAQLTLLDHPVYGHPAYWAPFLLINNWL